VKEDDPFLLYYPLKRGYVYRPKEKKFIPQEEDNGKALIFYDPSCPFCVYFSENIKKSIREVASDIPIRMLNKFEQSEEVEKRGEVPSCAVNGKPIETFFMDKENFQKEVKKALGSSG
jgi:predicted DsbA family dithiol-disulfide isomerase